MSRCLVLVAASALAACGSAPPQPAALKDLALDAAPACAVGRADTDLFYVALQNSRIVVVDAWSMKLSKGSDDLDSMPTCLAADATGGLAVGTKAGAALFFDTNPTPWRARVQPIIFLSRDLPVTAIGTLAPLRPPTPRDGEDAEPIGPTTAAACMALVARLKGSVATYAIPAANSATTPAITAATEAALKPFFVRALAVDPATQRCFALADGALHALTNRGGDAPANQGPVATRLADAKGALALAWSGAHLAVVGVDARLLEAGDPARTERLPYTGTLRLVQVAASDKLGYVAAIDEEGGVHAWRREAGAWRTYGLPIERRPASHLAIGGPSRRLLLIVKAITGKSEVIGIDLPLAATTAAPAP